MWGRGAVRRTRTATGSAGRAARRNPLAAGSRAPQNAAAMSPSSLRTARAGFTLIEMMVAISVVAILIGVAAPGLRDFMLNVRLTGYANDLLTALMLARSEATKRDVRVSVCARKKNNDGQCANGQQWDNG